MITFEDRDYMDRTNFIVGLFSLVKTTRKLILINNNYNF